MGDLAQKNGQSDDVKSYGKMLSADHAAANQKALDVAKGLGMNPPTEPNAKQKADYEKMSKTSGASFDKMFATHMVADHQKDIAEYKKVTKNKESFVKNVSEHCSRQGVVAIGGDRASITGRIKVP